MSFFLKLRIFYGVEKSFPVLVTDNEQDLTPGYPQKSGITEENRHYWFDLQP